jgi:hypothetical protein
MLDAPPRPLAARLQLNVEEWFEGDHYETLAICRYGPEAFIPRLEAERRLASLLDVLSPAQEKDL